jgi:pimeloyl-ACP methyl ester carboxylesterase
MMKRILRVVGFIGLVLVPLLLGVASFFRAAKITSSVSGLVAAAFVVQAAAAYGFSRLLRTKTIAVVSLHALVLGVAGWALLFHRPPYTAGTVGDRGIALEPWTLSTGSIVGIARLGIADPSRAPLVFLHGGPGGPLRPGDITFLRTLESRGLEVVVFEQAGVGASPHLPVSEYTIARAVADLEALRTKLGVERVSLLGQSWGAILAYEYLAVHPQRVERLVLTSPGPLDKRWFEFDVSKTAAANGGGPKFPPYFIATYLLHRINVEAALSFMPRDEGDARGIAIVGNGGKRWVCPEDGDAHFDVPTGGADLYQALAIKLEVERRTPPTLTRVVPTLVVRGGCDYLRREAAQDYVARLSGTLFEIPDVGHSLWPKRTDVVGEKIAAFLSTADVSAAP